MQRDRRGGSGGSLRPAGAVSQVAAMMALWMALQIAGSTWASAKKKLVQAIAVVTLAAKIAPNSPRNLAKSEGALSTVAAAKMAVDHANAKSITTKKSKRWNTLPK